jgi:hypothetical protein
MQNKKEHGLGSCGAYRCHGDLCSPKASLSVSDVANLTQSGPDHKNVSKTEFAKPIANVTQDIVTVGKISINRMPVEDVRQLALADYFNAHRRDHGFKNEEGFRDKVTVNYIRHKLTSYHNKLNHDLSQRQYLEAYTETMEAIKQVYPEFADEVSRQLSKKGGIRPFRG